MYQSRCLQEKSYFVVCLMLYKMSFEFLQNFAIFLRRLHLICTIRWKFFSRGEEDFAMFLSESLEFHGNLPD